MFTSHWRNEMYLTLVAADTGELLYRRNLTSESLEATYQVYTNANPAPFLPGWSAPSSAQPPPAERGWVTFAALNDTASPNGWIADGDNETRGNNVDAHLDRNDDDIADLPRPTGNPSRVFDFPHLSAPQLPANVVPMPAGFDAAFTRVKQLVADFRANEKSSFAHRMGEGGPASAGSDEGIPNRCNGLDRCPSLAGAGEGGRRPGEGCWEKTNFRALVYDLYALTPAEIQIVPPKPVCGRALAWGLILMCFPMLFCGCNTPDQDNTAQLFNSDVTLPTESGPAADAGRSQTNGNGKSSFPAQSGSNSWPMLSHTFAHIYANGNEYEGGWQFGSANGQGTNTLANGDKYVGEFQNGKRNGYGVYSWPTGDKYEGEWRDNMRTGEGTNTLANGRKYIGHFQNDKYNGFGTLIWTNGDKYEGNWQNNFRNGQGTMLFADGNKFVGNWQNDRRNGEGTMFLTNGGVYVGHWQDDRRNGDGVFTNRDGLKGTGKWLNGRLVEGTWYWPDGAKLEGTWYRDGRKNGGTISWQDGREYKGEWEIMTNAANAPEGEGTMTWPDGRKYTGDFKDGKIHGVGRMIFPDGKIQDGIWRDDQFVGAQPQTSEASNAISNSKSGLVNVTTGDASFEIYADGAFVGNSPAKLEISEGAHVIEVKKAGFKDYKREIKVLAGSELNLNAVLEKE
jgi:hypothetical protein